MADLNPCTVGTLLDRENDCHKLSYNRKAQLDYFKDFSDKNLELVRYRSHLFQLKSEDSICLHHQKVYLDKFEDQYKTCFDPFQRHKVMVKTTLRPVTIEMVHLLKKITKQHVIPGWKICFKCFKEASSYETNMEEPDVMATEAAMDVANESFIAMGASPLKVSKLSEPRKLSYAKRKLKRAQETMETVVATALEKSPDVLKQKSSFENCSNCEDLDLLIKDLKEKCAISNHREQVQILTLAPKSWTVEKTSQEFCVSVRMVKLARELVRERGILAQPEPKKGWPLPEQVKQNVLQFYEDDQNSRICPGMKDYVSVKIGQHKEHKQKRLLLCNLHELYLAYKESFDHKIGFSTFCELRPKWCVTVGSSGTHNVCVCTVHQNVKLMTSALVLGKHI